MKKCLFFSLAVAFCCTMAPPPSVANDVGTMVSTVKKEQVYQAPTVLSPIAYSVCELADATYILISPTQATHLVAVVPAKVYVPVLAAKVMGGLPRSPGRNAYALSYCNRFSNSRCNGNRIYHIDPGLRGC